MSRTEHDSMGPVELPAGALYGASTQRAVDNFPVSGRRLPPAFIAALAEIKRACALANAELGELDEDRADLIRRAAEEILEGRHADQFPVDVFQTGSGTSTNMNLNEVLANRCSQLAGEAPGSKTPVHPNDHCNRGQSSNDVIPSALHLALLQAVDGALLPALERMEEALAARARDFAGVVKTGRTHLMDATPLRLGDEFSGYAAQLAKGRRRVAATRESLSELAVGGTAVGTGLNTHPQFGARVCAILSARTGLPVREAGNHFEAQSARDAAVELAGQLTTLTASLVKIANDLRLSASGPRCGIGELRLPATQPGSSIMPGKVNPVMAETLVQTCNYVFGLCTGVAVAGRDGYFQLNTAIPMIAYSLLESLVCLANAANLFTARCIEGLEADTERCRDNLERSLMRVTALNPLIGYEKAAEVAKVALEQDKTLREVVLEQGLLDAATVDAALDPAKMLGKPPEEKSR